MTKEELLQKLTIVDMNHAGITTIDKPIIGTRSLSTCLGVLLYDEQDKIAIAAHATSGDPNVAMKEVIKLIKENKLEFASFKYKIFDGYYQDAAAAYHSKETIINRYIKLNLFFASPFKEEEIPSTALLKDPALPANEFYFDVQTGRFVTEEVQFLLQNNTVTEEVSKPKHR